MLNARTDAFLLGEGRTDAEKTAEAIERGRAYLAEGAVCVFVPGRLDEPTIEQLVAGLGERTLSVIGSPVSVAPARLQELGVARVSYGPWSQRVALTALQETAAELYAGGGIPSGTRMLN